jgi:hypothetical protein
VRAGPRAGPQERTQRRCGLQVTLIITTKLLLIQSDLVSLSLCGLLVRQRPAEPPVTAHARATRANIRTSTHAGAAYRATCVAMIYFWWLLISWFHRAW